MQSIKLGKHRELNRKCRNYIVPLNEGGSKLVDLLINRHRFCRVFNRLFKNNLDGIKIVSECENWSPKSCHGYTINYISLNEIKELVQKEENILVINIQFSPSLLKTMLESNNDNYLIQTMCTTEELRAFIYC